VIVVLLGPPGAGKGTQGERIAAALGVPKIATGDVLRAAIKAGTPLGAEAKAYMDRGDLVPDAVILGIMKEALAAPAQVRGGVVDGGGGTVPKAEGLVAVLKELGRPLDVVMLFTIPNDLLVARLSARTVCDACQTPFTGKEPGLPHAGCPKTPAGVLERRPDDEPVAVRNRLQVYESMTAPVIAWYREHNFKIAEIDAVGTLAEVEARALAAVGK